MATPPPTWTAMSAQVFLANLCWRWCPHELWWCHQKNLWAHWHPRGGWVWPYRTPSRWPGVFFIFFGSYSNNNLYDPDTPTVTIQSYSDREDSGLVAIIRGQPKPILDRFFHLITQKKSTKSAAPAQKPESPPVLRSEMICNHKFPLNKYHKHQLFKQKT